MTNNNVKKLFEKIEGKQSISDKFHSFTKNKKLNTTITKDVPQSWIKIHFKTYPRLDKVNLNNVRIPTNKLTELLRRRRSTRQFSGASISKRELFYLLFLSCGLTYLGESFDDSRRPYPSAGGRYPLEVYPIVLNCEGIKRGLYHYNVKENLLELLLEENLSKWLIKITGGEKWITSAAVAFIITGVLDRTRIKYGDRGYRYALIEAGHLGQNICLLATELGLGSCSLGGFIDDKINELLDIKFQKESSIYVIAVGKL